MSYLKTFLGFPVDPLFESHLQQNNAHLVSLFTGGGDYLKNILLNNRSYLGKFVSPAPTYERLESIQLNILSLLRKLAPLYPFNEDSLVLLAISKDEA
ncbi:MAG: hypothetical protein WAM28_04940 [Chlamydiales bacterium]